MTGIREDTTRRLSDGNQIPMLGLGVWQVPEGPECVNAVRWALELGYRHIDTAQAYGNEESVGQGLRESGVPREEVFITTKFFPRSEDPAAEAERSLERLGVDYVDLYIVHWPSRGPTCAWPGMERARELGYARSIGVSNFDSGELEQVMASASVAPVVNQVQFSPYEYRSRLLAACEASDVILEAYSPLDTAAICGAPPSRRSRNASNALPPKCCCAGASSGVLPSSPSQLTATASSRTPRSSTSRSPTRTWRRLTRSTKQAEPIPRRNTSGGEPCCAGICLGGRSRIAS
jgi:diketogulonate reductase-like aldo/keto reductase